MINTTSWESKLMALALEGLSTQASNETNETPSIYQDEVVLRQAYQECDQITRQHSRTFYLASGLLPVEKCRAARVLYAFCRITDDLVDLPPDSNPDKLSAWAQTTLAELPERGNSVALAWHSIRTQYQIPLRYAEQLIEGVAKDMFRLRYETFEDLVAYCYGVASTVGLMTMHIIGFNGTEAVQYAVRLGVALQLTNILRDVGEDWQKGRLYLPLSELHQYGLDESDLARRKVNDRWRSFMRFQIERTRQIYDSAIPGIRLLNKDGRFAITAAALLYKAILEDIERNDYDVFNRRAYVSTWGKLRRLPWIWIKSL